MQCGIQKYLAFEFFLVLDLIWYVKHGLEVIWVNTVIKAFLIHFFYICSFVGLCFSLLFVLGWFWVNKKAKGFSLSLDLSFTTFCAPAMAKNWKHENIFVFFLYFVSLFFFLPFFCFCVFVFLSGNYSDQSMVTLCDQILKLV